MWYTETNTFQF